MSRRPSRLVSVAATLALASVASLGAAGGSHAQAPSFDGITMIELKDAVGERAIGGSGDYILTFVSGVGTYAAVLDAPNGRGCVAWAREGSYTGSSITFGLAAEEYEADVPQPGFCLPFTLTFEDADTVRVSAENMVAEIGEPKSLVRYSRRRSIITQIPLRGLDWSLPGFTRLHVGDVRLGPIRTGGAVAYQVSDLHQSTSGIYKNVRASPGGKIGDETTVLGRAAGKEMTGWPWDVTYALWSGKYLSPQSTRSAFEAEIVAEYGQPGFVHDTSKIWYWLYDLDGRLLGRNDAARGNCLLTMDLWNRESLPSQNSDFGPWGCSVVMALTHGNADTVSSYRIELVSGYVKALNHFLTRIEELEQMRAKAELIESVEPQL